MRLTTSVYGICVLVWYYSYLSKDSQLVSMQMKGTLIRGYNNMHIHDIMFTVLHNLDLISVIITIVTQFSSACILMPH